MSLRAPVALVLGLAAWSCGSAPAAFELSDIAFFESAKPEDDPLSPHDYLSTFDAAKARYVHARVTVAYAQGGEGPIQLSCALLDPSGATLDTRTRDVTLPESATRTSWSVGFGGGEGTWKPGEYRASCTAGPNRVLGRFEVAARPLGREAQFGQAPDAAKPSPGLPPWAGPPTPGLLEPSKPLWDRLEPATPSPVTTRSIVDVKHQLHFYEQGDDDVQQQVGSHAFDATSARYIGFALEIPPLGDNEILAVRPDATRCSYQRLDSPIVLRTTFALRTTMDGPLTLLGRSGHKDPGFWAPGIYEFRCEAEGVAFARSGFLVRGLPLGLQQTVSLSQAGPLEFDTTSLRIFEAASPVAPERSRGYGARFWNTARYIVAHIDFTHAPPREAAEVPVACGFYDRVGRPVGSYTQPHRVSPGDTRGWVTAGWGNPRGGTWGAGLYFVECAAGTDLMARRVFEIVERP
jgi:hypothetical protein